MENLLKRNKHNKENDYELYNKIDEELKRFEYHGEDMSERDDLSDSGYMTPHNKRDLNESSLSSLNLESGAWNELKLANQERDQAFTYVEKNIEIMKLANQQQFFQYDYEDMEEKPLSLHNEIIPEEKANEIKQTILQKPLEIENRDKKSLISNRSFLNIDNTSSKIELNHSFLKEEPTNKDKQMQEGNNDSRQKLVDEEELKIMQRLERAQADREILHMEKEDTRSLKHERNMHQEKFKDRLFCLPETFPLFKETNLRLGIQDLNLSSKSKLFVPYISLPILNPKNNLLETSKTEIDKIVLNKIVNKKKNNLQYQKIHEKDKVLLSKSLLDLSKTTSTRGNLSHQEKRDKNSSLLKKAQNLDSHSLISLKGSGEKTHHLNQFSTQNLNLTKWILNKSFTLNSKIIKLDSNELRALIKEMPNYSKNSICFNLDFSNADQILLNEIMDSHIGRDDSKKSLETFVSKLQQKNLNKLEIKMENLIDIKTIEKFQDLQLLIMPMNKIQEIRELNSLKLLIEVDLSQNSIKSMKGLSNLKYLRILNLEVNLISKIEDLDGCERLEILNINNNQITKIEGFKSLKRLKKLSLFRNKITSTDGIEDLPYLEELDLGRNLIQDFSFIKKLPVLRKLVLYFNLIEKLPQYLSHVSLSEVWLNGNKLTDISGLAYLPSLKLLNLQENEISVLTKDSFVFTPSLKMINLSFNKIESFGQLYKLLASFGSLQQIDLIENPFLRRTTETLKEFYENILTNLLPNLTEINSKPLNSSNSKLLTLRNNLFSESLFLSPGRLENDMHHIDKITSGKLSRHQNSFYIQSNQIKARNNVGLFYLSKMMEITNLATENIYNLDHKYSYEIHIRSFEYRVALHKIKSFITKIIFKKRKLKKHYSCNLSKVIQLQANYRGFRLRKIYDVKKIMKKKNEEKSFLALAKFALKIQKVFRGHQARKRLRDYKNFVNKNTKYEDPELDELEEVDMSFLKKEPNYDTFTIKLPVNFLEQFATSKPQPVSVKQGNQSQNHIFSKSKAHQNFIESSPSIREEDEKQEEEYSISSHSGSKEFTTIRLKEQSPSLKKSIGLNSEQKEKIFNEWGIKDENVQKWLENKILKEQKRKEKKKPLNAQERYKKFLENTKKP